MDSAKGKGRAPPANDEGKPQSKPDDTASNSSMLSRVATSASGLTRSAFSAPNTNELNETTAAALSSSGKGSSSGTGSGSSAWAESSKAAQQPTNSQFDGAARESFRAGHSEEHANQAEREFSSFLDGIDSFQSSEPVTGTGRDEHNALAEAWTRSQSPRKPHTSGFQSSTVTEQESRDGEEVLAMLSDPNSLSEQFEAPEPEDENYDWGLSAEQRTQLRAMTKDMFPAPEHHAGVDPDHSLNLIPNFGAEDGNLEARRVWREQWEGVLTRYTDEVWGGLLPLVEEARKEVEEMRNENGVTEQPKALRRLGAILEHLQKR
jgi:hypothetical protein